MELLLSLTCEKSVYNYSYIGLTRSILRRQDISSRDID